MLCHSSGTFTGSVLKTCRCSEAQEHPRLSCVSWPRGGPGSFGLAEPGVTHWYRGRADCLVPRWLHPFLFSTSELPLLYFYFITVFCYVILRNSSCYKNSTLATCSPLWQKTLPSRSSHVSFHLYEQFPQVKVQEFCTHHCISEVGGIGMKNLNDKIFCIFKLGITVFQ